MARAPLGYRELADILREEITSGGRTPGSRMPSEADLRQAHGVSRWTARAALQLLAAEGLIEVRHGHPTRVREAPARTSVRIQRGASFVVRPATAAERVAHGLEPGDRMVEVTYGAKIFVYRADRHIFTTT